MLKLLVLFFFSEFIYLCIAFHQDTYRITHDSVIIDTYNHSAIRDPYINVEEFNATNKKGTIRGHAYFTPGVKKNILISALLYKLVGKVYRSFPMNISFDLCDEIKHNVLGAQVAIEHSNLNSCPCKPGYYYIKDYVIEDEKFPPHLPFGKYKLFVKVYVDDKIFMGNGTWMGAIVKKNKN